MTYSEKVLAFIRRWIINAQSTPGEYAAAYAYKANPQKLILYKAYNSSKETMAKTIFAPSKEAYLDDDVLEKEVFDALNKLKEDVDREHVSKKVARMVNCAKDILKEDGYDTSVLDISYDGTAKWVIIKATAVDGPRKFVAERAERAVTYEEVLKLCDPVDALVTIMGDLINEVEERIGDDMEPAEAINIIKSMLDSSQLSPWQKEALGVAIKAMTEKM